MAAYSSSLSFCGSLGSCCRRGHADHDTCNCHDCRLADLTNCQPVREDGTAHCGGNCKVLHTHCLGLSPQYHAAEGEVPVQVGGDEGVSSDGQAQVFMFYEQLTNEQKEKLDEAFNSIDPIFFKDDFFADAKEAEEQALKANYEVPAVMDWERKATPKMVPGANVTFTEKVPAHKISAWRSMGLDMYGKGYVAVVIMAAGMDSRMGQGIPKGILDFGLLSGKSILQLYAERLRRLQMLVSRRMEGESELQVRIPLYIMCNEDNLELLRNYFEENDYFGLTEEDVTFFKQGLAPVVDHLGRFILSDRGTILQEPCGNGYLFQALSQEGLIQDIKSRFATHLSVLSIDNILGKIGDPAFLGFCKHVGTEAAIKCTRKRSPNEALGVLTTRREMYYEDIDGDGTVDIVTKLKGINVEFFQMPENVKTKRINAGTTDLAFDSGNLSQYVFKVGFMKRVQPHMYKKWHLVPKSKNRIHFLSGEVIKAPTRGCNVYRPETFVFDSFEFTKAVAAYQVPREEHAILKNMHGLDSPQTALAAIGKLHQGWITAAGGEFVGSKIATDRDDAKCEVSPLVSYDGEDLKGQFWMPIELPFYLPSQNEHPSASAVELDTGKEDSLHFLDKDTVAAKKAVEAELKFQIESMFAGKTTDGDKQHAFDEADSEEELPSTPEEMVTERDTVMVVKEVKKEKVVDPNRHLRHALHVDHDEIEVTGVTEFMLSARADSGHHALSTRGTARKESDSSRKSTGSSPRSSLLRGARARAMPGSTRSASAKKPGLTSVARGGKMYTGRAQLLGEHWDGERPSLRCLPKHHHGLEKSEYGRRKPHTDYSLSAYWAAQKGPEKEKKAQGSSVPSSPTGSGVMVDATPPGAHRHYEDHKQHLECTIS